MSSQTCYAVRPTVDYKGHGVFATERIECGTRILKEKPVLTLPRQQERDGKINYSILLSRFNALSDADKQLYLQLTTSELSSADGVSKDCFADSENLEMIISEVFSNNMFEHPTRQRGKGVAVFLTASRINHSCLPSVIAASNPEDDTMTFHALRDIDAGEELTISYISAAMKFRSREDAIRKYGFDCACPACKQVRATPQGEADVDPRELIEDLEGQLEEHTKLREHEAMDSGRTLFGGESVGESPLLLVGRLCVALEAEGLVGKELGLW